MNITATELRKIILQQLKTQPQVESVEELVLSQKSDAIGIKGQITAMGYDIGFSGKLKNSGSGIVLDDPVIEAGFLVKAFVRPYLKRVPQLTKSFLEKQYGKKFKSIQVTDKGLELSLTDE